MRKFLSVVIILVSLFWIYNHYYQYWRQNSNILIYVGYIDDWILTTNIVFGFIGVGLGTLSLIKKISIKASILLTTILFIIGMILQLNLSDFGINI